MHGSLHPPLLSHRGCTLPWTRRLSTVPVVTGCFPPESRDAVPSCLLPVGLCTSDGQRCRETYGGHEKLSVPAGARIPCLGAPASPLLPWGARDDKGTR